MKNKKLVAVLKIVLVMLLSAFFGYLVLEPSSIEFTVKEKTQTEETNLEENQFDELINFAEKILFTAVLLKVSAPRPYTVSVGKATIPPRLITPAASMSKSVSIFSGLILIIFVTQILLSGKLIYR
mgnify:CR=1 FL=1